MARVRYFAAAAEAAGTDSETIEAATLSQLLDSLRAGRGEVFAATLARCAVLADGRRVDDPSTPLDPDARVDVLPPFAGG